MAFCISRDLVSLLDHLALGKSLVLTSPQNSLLQSGKFKCPAVPVESIHTVQASEQLVPYVVPKRHQQRIQKVSYHHTAITIHDPRYI